MKRQYSLKFLLILILGISICAKCFSPSKSGKHFKEKFGAVLMRTSGSGMKTLYMNFYDSEVVEIEFSSISLTKKEVYHLKNLFNLESIVAPGCDLSPEFISFCASNPKLVYLDLSSTNLSDNDLATLARNKTIKRICVRNSKNITIPEITRLLKTYPNLEIVSWYD